MKDFKIISTENFLKNKIRENYYNKSDFDLKQFTINANELNKWCDEYARYYATECIKNSLQKAFENSLFDFNTVSKNNAKEYKESIINESNIILL